MKRNENTIEKKNLKKKILMVTGLALLLGLVGYTGGTTYAKYIDQASAESTTATVAKWGHVVTISDADLFGSDYTLQSGADLATEVDGVGVAVNSTGNVLAPGTTGSMSFTISGKAEVLSKLTVVATGKDVGLFDGTNAAFPVKWTLSKDGSAVAGNTDVTLSTIVSTLNGWNNEEIAIGNASTHAGKYTLSWAWAFSTSGYSTIKDLTDYDHDNAVDDELSNDGVDTIMGWLADTENQANSAVHEAGYSLVDSSKAANSDWEFSLRLVVEQLAE